MKMRSHEKRNLLYLFSAVYLTGLSLYLLVHFIRVSSPIGEQHHASEPWIRIVHATLTYGMVMAMGYVVKSHVIPGLRARSQNGKKSGLTMLTWFSLMVISALGVLYSQEGNWRTFITQAHGILGLATPLLILLHLRSRKSTALKS
jgi:hypothetical protein